MQVLRPSALRRHLLVLSTVMAGFVPFAGGQPSFTISATNVTMSPKTGSYSQLKLTSVDGYSGTIYVDCRYAGAPTNARLPICSGYTMQNDFKLAADQTITFDRTFYPYGAPLPVDLPLSRGQGGRLLAAGLGLAGVLFLGFGFRRRLRHWLALLALSAIGLTGITGCNSFIFIGTTPGTYGFIIIATDIHTTITVVANIWVFVH